MFCLSRRRATPPPRIRHAMMLGVATLAVASLAQAQVTTSAGGANAAAIQAQVDAFRASLGPLNPNVAGSFGTGRREINWDAVPNAFSAPNALPANFFNVNSPRGVVFSTTGSGFALSANAASGTPVEFGNIDPTYANVFDTFSTERLFTAIGSNIVDVNFFIAGSPTAAVTRGFGAVFSDVDLASTTSLQFFDSANSSLGIFFAPTGMFSFLGVSFGSSLVSRVRITSGNTALAAGVLDGPVPGAATRDLVVMDDFIYAETVTPEPSTYALFVAGLLGIAAVRRRQRV